MSNRTIVTTSKPGQCFVAPITTFNWMGLSDPAGKCFVALMNGFFEKEVAAIKFDEKDSKKSPDANEMWDRMKNFVDQKAPALLGVTKIKDPTDTNYDQDELIKELAKRQENANFDAVIMDLKAPETEHYDGRDVMEDNDLTHGGRINYVEVHHPDHDDGVDEVDEVDGVDGPANDDDDDDDSNGVESDNDDEICEIDDDDDSEPGEYEPGVIPCGLTNRDEEEEVSSGSFVPPSSPVFPDDVVFKPFCGKNLNIIKVLKETIPRPVEKLTPPILVTEKMIDEALAKHDPHPHFSLGPDQIPIEMWLSTECREWLQILFNSILGGSRIPTIWNRGFVDLNLSDANLVRKQVFQFTAVDKLRVVITECEISLVWQSILKHLIDRVAIPSGKVYGPSEYSSIDRARLALERIIYKSKDLWGVFLKVKSCFSSMSVHTVLAALSFKEVHPAYINAVRDIFMDFTVTARQSHNKQIVTFTDHLRKGSPLSPLLFINGLDYITHMRHNNVEDLVIYGPHVALFCEGFKELQNQVKKWSRHLNVYEMAFDTDEATFVHFDNRKELRLAGGVVKKPQRCQVSFLGKKF